ncbi:hypothetical protein KZI27_00320 (plasmid) [Curtobacterium sp. TC1]|uniref:hypothetical protein n=1 Tax=Curtobacterium sp. TC1 TaxID=2862880 RepID=UPI001C9A6202|nr:hypothetical protein [Curtobacterium sp. TC1]QZQ53720.1 hypothetical protein KZI27_00320 [Curtobacterium sp. TC1]
MRKRNTLIMAAGIGAIASLVFVPAANADTVTPTPTPETTTSVGTMTVAGYDPAVAEAHGFKIVTAADGSQSSVPITAAAKAEAAKAKAFDATAAAKALGASADAVTPQGTKPGNCGISVLTGSKGANDMVNFKTGFTVRLPYQEFNWRVQANGFITGGTKNWHGGAGDGYWRKSSSIKAVGPGTALVPALNSAARSVLEDGTICYSDGPDFSFG